MHLLLDSWHTPVLMMQMAISGTYGWGCVECLQDNLIPVSAEELCRPRFEAHRQIRAGDKIL